MSHTLLQPNPTLLERERPVVTDALLAGMAQRIVEAFHPYRVILFGSYAYGIPHAYSDVDLLVIVDETQMQGHAKWEVRAAARVPHLEMDLLVYSPIEIETRLAMGDFFIREIMTRGHVLYDCGKMWIRRRLRLR